nr:hypothetical protein GCM10020063_059980 [Dactylosporangium thailandense]
MPGAVSVRTLTQFGEDDPDDYVTYSPQAWEELLLSLGRVPYLAALDCVANGRDGDSSRGPYLVFAAVRIERDGRAWLQLSLPGTGFEPHARQAALLDVLRVVADQANGSGPAGTGAVPRPASTIMTRPQRSACSMPSRPSCRPAAPTCGTSCRRMSCRPAIPGGEPLAAAQSSCFPGVISMVRPG